MKRLLLILLTLSLFLPSFGILSHASLKAGTNAVSSASRDQNLLDSGGEAFAMRLSTRQRADCFDLRLIVVEDLRKSDHSADLTVTFSFSDKGETREQSYTLKSEGGDFKRYASVTAGGKAFRAAENHALFGIVIGNVPYEGFSTLRATIVQRGKTLYTGQLTYGAIFSSDSAFSASAVTDLSQKWMSFLADDTPVNRITIPGSHDSGAMFDHSLMAGTAKTQNATIAEQLNMGVRGLDMRCKVNGSGGFSIYHGVVDQKLTFDEVIDACEKFLSDHPGEIILMSIKEEDDNNANFASIAKAYIEKNPDLWYTRNSIPTLGEARGRIVLLRRFSASGTLGIKLDSGWADNTAFTVNNGVSCRIQDFYSVGSSNETNLNKKWTMIEEQLNYAHGASAKNTLCINFTSGYTTGMFSIPNIPSVSNSVNPNLKSFFDSAEKGCYGLILSDFAAADLSESIYMANFES